MSETQGSTNISPRLTRIAKLAKDKPGVPLWTLAHHIDVNWLREAFRRTRKDGATGADGVDAETYGKQLEVNLRSLLKRAKSGAYRAPPVRRVHIRRAMACRHAPSASRPSRTRCCNARSRWFSKPCTSSRSTTSRMASGPDVPHIRHSRTSDMRRWEWEEAGSWRSISRSTSTRSITDIYRRSFVNGYAMAWCCA